MEMHLSPTVLPLIQSTYQWESHGLHLRMLQAERGHAFTIDTSEVEPLPASAFVEAQAFYDAYYPGHAFEAAQLRDGHFFCVRQSGQLIAAAGLHVYAPEFGIAAIGNILTHPDWRGRGLAQRVTARLLVELYPTTHTIGLNVSANNLAAIRTYTRLGFTARCNLMEGCGVRRSNPTGPSGS